MTTSKTLGAAATARPGRLWPCMECGQQTRGGEFHPYWHCVLVKGGVDPTALDPPDPHIEQAEADLAQAYHALVLYGEHLMVWDDSTHARWCYAVEFRPATQPRGECDCGFGPLLAAAVAFAEVEK